MDKKLSVAMMVFVLVVMASTGGEASYISCTFKCEVLCDDQDYKTECVSKCMARCKNKTPPPFTQLNHTRSKLGHKFSRVQSQISTLDVLMIAWHIKGS
ncbi:hypothetical protein YC2023_105557 [Brassica napus]